MPITDNALRTFYTVGVLTWIVLFMRERGLPYFMSKLSNETLVIYLLHILVIHAVLPFTLAWHPALRLGFIAPLALVSTSLFASVARHLLGANRARKFLGV